MCFRRRRVRQQISILVPFGGEDPGRLEALKWLLAYYRAQLPAAEIVLGSDKASKRSWHNKKPKPFSKAVALNNAFAKSHGDILILLDSDAILADGVIEHCAERLRAQRRAGVRSYFIPYQHLFRLTREATKRILASDPAHPLVLPDPPPPSDVEGRDGSGPINTFGAMCQIVPREAFILVGGFDTRHRGWGSDDHDMVLALNELWGHFKTTPNDILHLWHPRIMAGDGAAWRVRMWQNQLEPNMNQALAARYSKAVGHPDVMRALVDEDKGVK